MATQTTRAFLEFLRQFATDIVVTVGAQADYAKFPTVTLSSDVRVQNAIDWMLAREAVLIARFTMAYEPFWSPAQEEVWMLWATKFAALPVDDPARAGFDTVMSDPDQRARQFFRLTMRLMSREMQEFRAREAGV